VVETTLGKWPDAVTMDVVAAKPMGRPGRSVSVSKNPPCRSMKESLFRLSNAGSHAKLSRVSFYIFTYFN